MHVRFSRYSGSKFKYINLINKKINLSISDTYIEPFVGGGSIFFNLEREFKRYIINDFSENVIKMYTSFKYSTYKMYNDCLLQTKEFGDIKSSKESYYKFRAWFNENVYKSNTYEEGFYIHVLANACINSFLRFSKSGMNQGFGNRMYIIQERDFEFIKSKLSKAEILCTDYLDIHEDGFYFLDPPYFDAPSSYENNFKGSDIQKFHDYLEGKEFVYTDILNDYNKHLEYDIIREMRSTAPGTNKALNNNIECIFYSESPSHEIQQIINEW